LNVNVNSVFLRHIDQGINLSDQTCHYRVMWLSVLMMFVLVVKEQSHSEQMSE